MYRTAEYRLNSRKKAIAKKKNILIHVLGETESYTPVRQPGRLDKMHIGCGCGLCKPRKRFRYPSDKDERRLARADYMIKEYAGFVKS